MAGVRAASMKNAKLLHYLDRRTVCEVVLYLQCNCHWQGIDQDLFNFELALWFKGRVVDSQLEEPGLNSHERQKLFAESWM